MNIVTTLTCDVALLASQKESFMMEHKNASYEPVTYIHGLTLRTHLGFHKPLKECLVLSYKFSLNFNF